MKFTQAIKEMVIGVMTSVVRGDCTKNESTDRTGWKVKAYRVGTYFRVDIFPPDHGGK